MILFDTINSDDYGAKVFRKETDEAPVNEYDAIPVPGRLGSVLYDKRYRENVEMEYDVVFYLNARKSCEDMKNALQALTGYHRLMDSDYPDEYFWAYISERITPVYTPEKGMAKFVLTFSRKPQRFLVSGDTVYSPISGELRGHGIYTDFSQGNIDTIYFHVAQTYASKKSTSLYNVNFEGVGTIDLYFNGELLQSWDGYDNVMEADCQLTSGGRFTINVTKIIEDLPTDGWQKDTGYGSLYYVAVSTPPLACSFSELIPASYTYKHVGQCWYDDGYLYVMAPANLTTLEKFTAWLELQAPQVVSYGGGGSTMQTIGFDFPNEWGYLYSPSAELEISVNGSNVLTNPTLFASAPLIRVFGTGTVTVNDITITVDDCDEYVDIDCDMMDCYEGGINRNKDVSFSTPDFPTLEPGDNTFVISGASGLQVTPRWWRL